MQKKLIAVAVAGALGVPALAMAQASTVQLYGRIALEYGYVNQGSGRPNTDVMQTPGGAAIGVRGEEKLGGGLSAWFQCESSADVRGVSQNGFCSRNSAVGFKHDTFGNIHIGRWDTPLKRASSVGMAGSQSTGLLGAAFLLAGNSSSVGATGGQGASQSLSRNIWKRRESSQIYYESPTFKGFQALAAYSSANATAVTDGTLAAKPRVISVAAIYKNGPLGLNGGYEQHNNFGAVGGANNDHAFTAGASLNVFGAGTPFKLLGDLKIAGQYIDARYEAASNGSLQKRNWMIGTDWHIMGPHNIEAAYVHAGNSKGSATAAQVTAAGLGGGNGALVAPGGGTGGDLYSIGYKHVLSKRNSVTLTYVRLINDNRANYSLGGLRAGTTLGQNMDAVALYVQHSF